MRVLPDRTKGRSPHPKPLSPKGVRKDARLSTGYGDRGDAAAAEMAEIAEAQALLAALARYCSPRPRRNASKALSVVAET
jgi:hypothetical protein